MRVLIVSQYFWPELFRINDIAAYLTGQGHEVTVLTGRPNYPGGDVFPEYRADPASFSSYSGADVVRVPMIPRGASSLRLMANYLSFAVSASTIGAWRLKRRSFDAILVFQVSPVTAALPAIVQRRLKRAPLAMWVLDLWPETLSAVGAVHSKAGLGLVGKLVSFIYRRCDRILVQSKAFTPSIEQRTGGSVPISYFPAWAETTFEAPLEAVELAPELVPFRDTFNIMFAGNVGEAQDFPAIVAAADALRDRANIRWLIVGDGRAVDSVRSDIKARNLDDRVIFLGSHPVERMPSFFKGAHALLVSLKPEPVFAMTIPGKVQSYMRSGTPIIAMLDGEGARVIEEAGAGLVCSAGDSAGLAGIVARLAGTSAQERSQMGAAARAYCEREFDRGALLNRLEAWLMDMRTNGRGSERARVVNPRA